MTRIRLYTEETDDTERRMTRKRRLYTEETDDTEGTDDTELQDGSERGGQAHGADVGD